MGTHQGAVSHKHRDYYLDEFTFRFNRRNSASHNKLFFRLAQQALAAEPATYDAIVQKTRSRSTKARYSAVARKATELRMLRCGPSRIVNVGNS